MLGDNGIIGRAKTAGEETRGASVEEQVGLWKTDIEMIKHTGGTAESYEQIRDRLYGEKLLTDGDIQELEKPENTNKEVTIGSKTISFKADSTGGNEGQYEEGFDSTKGVNKPKVVTGMQPVKFVGTTPTNTEPTDADWYDYELNTGTFGQDNTNNRQAKWANATIQNGSYFVWVPRYAYKIVSGEHKSGVDINPTTPTLGSGKIDIIFLQGTTNKDKDGNPIPSDYIIHPAFDFGGAKEGIWVGKYEASNDGSGKVKIVPGVTSYRNINVSTMFSKAQAMAGENSLSGIVDTHMMKNSEWGCVSYLAHSKYGRNGVEVTINNSSGYITGAAGSSIADITTSANGTYAYNTSQGQLASTTGNITGIYDMSGGAWEYVMGVLEGTVGSSGFSSLPTDTKYYDSYKKDGTGSDRTLNYAQNGDKKGDAIFETSSNSASPWTLSWFADSSYFVNSSNPVFTRGGDCYNGSFSGLFSFSTGNGGAYSYNSFRSVLVL